MKKARLDAEIARRGLAPSRTAAQSLILAGRVRVDSRPAGKADLPVDPALARIEIVGDQQDYASRGAYKLIAALDRFHINVEGCLAVDLGASTGGFTDVLLRRGTRRVIALDVGYGQLIARLRNDPRVEVMDRTNVRRLKAADLSFRPELVVVDVSFIGLELVLPVIGEVAAAGAEVIALVKPQFEVGKGQVGKGGVVRDPELRQRALEKVLARARQLGFAVAGTIESPITGAAGNVEYLAHLRVARAAPGVGET